MKKFIVIISVLWSCLVLSQIDVTTMGGLELEGRTTTQLNALNTLPLPILTHDTALNKIVWFDVVNGQWVILGGGSGGGSSYSFTSPLVNTGGVVALNMASFDWTGILGQYPAVGNLSGINTGDQDLSPYFKKDGSVAATADFNMNGNSLNNVLDLSFSNRIIAKGNAIISMEEATDLLKMWISLESNKFSIASWDRANVVDPYSLGSRFQFDFIDSRFEINDSPIITVANAAANGIGAGGGSGTDDQIASEVSITDASNWFTSTSVEGALAEIALTSSSTHPQELSAPTAPTVGQVYSFGAGDNGLWIDPAGGVGGGGADDQTASEVPITDVANYFTATNTEDALQEVALAIIDKMIAPLNLGAVTPPTLGQVYSFGAGDNGLWIDPAGGANPNPNKITNQKFITGTTLINFSALNIIDSNQPVTTVKNDNGTQEVEIEVGDFLVGQSFSFEAVGSVISIHTKENSAITFVDMEGNSGNQLIVTNEAISFIAESATVIRARAGTVSTKTFAAAFPPVGSLVTDGGFDNNAASWDLTWASGSTGIAGNVATVEGTGSLGSSGAHHELRQDNVFENAAGGTYTVGFRARLISGSGNILVGQMYSTIFSGAITSSWADYEVTGYVKSGTGERFLVFAADSGVIYEFDESYVILE